MYTKEQLITYPCFREMLAETGSEGLLDQLTGVLSRGHILWYAQYLIRQGMPFSFAILDLDNFKFINDTYGHHIGDRVLMQVARDLEECLAGKGLAGRFGGDEFLMVNFRDLAYEDKKAFFKDMYENRVLRKNVVCDGCTPFITGTVGCASFPADAADYDGLFALIDKTLYRGKTKGRNCHIIYVEEKHKNLEIRKLAKRGMYSTFYAMNRHFEFVPGIVNKLRSVTPLIMEELQVTDLYYVGKGGLARAVRNEEYLEPAGDIGKLLYDDMFATNDVEAIAEKAPEFYQTLRKREVETVLIVRVGMEMDTNGYLFCAEPRNRRIWQEAECAILYFLAKLLAAHIRIKGEPLD